MKLPGQRFDPAVESAAYRVIAQTINRDGDQPVLLDAHADGGVLVVELESSEAAEDLGDLEDRVGALGGTLERSTAPAGHARIRAEIPCAS